MDQLDEDQQRALTREFVQTFVSERKRERYLEELKKSSGLHKVLADLARRPFLNERVAVRVTGSDRTADRLADRLKTLGFPASVPVLSEHSNLHGHVLDLRDALRMALGSGMVTILIGIPGRLAFFEGEDGSDRFILCAK